MSWPETWHDKTNRKQIKDLDDVRDIKDDRTQDRM